MVSDKGLFSDVSFTETHDSSLAWSSELISDVGYDFSPKVSVGLGVPIYLVQPYSRYKTTSTSGVSYNSIGDLFTTLNYNAGNKGWPYSGTITGTVPTGDTQHGVSTGRATIDWNNHLEHDIWRLTPYVEAGIGNSNTSENLRHGGLHGYRNYTTLGGLTHYRGGSSVDLFKNLSFDACVYDDLPFGDQKVYSRILPRKGTVATAASASRHFEMSAVTTGGASIAADYGIDTALNLNPNRRINLGLEYTRSVHYQLNTVALMVGYRFGHMASKETPR